jgi:hypothetical protein
MSSSQVGFPIDGDEKQASCGVPSYHYSAVLFSAAAETSACSLLADSSLVSPLVCIH